MYGVSAAFTFGVSAAHGRTYPLQAKTHKEHEVVSPGKWILVKYVAKTKDKHYIGQVLELNGDMWKVKYLKKNPRCDKFYWPVQEDIGNITEEEIVRVLPEPTIDRRGNCFVFGIKFHSLAMY
jgi:hypothetical protein